MTTLKEAMNDPDAIQRALEAAHKDQQDMKATPTNKDEELRDKCQDIQLLTKMDDAKWKRRFINDEGLFGFIQSEVSTKIAEVLNRLEESNNLGIWTTSTESLVEVHQKTISKAIQAERNKLTQEEGSDAHVSQVGHLA